VESRHPIFSWAALLIPALLYWGQLAIAARYDSTHNMGSTSQGVAFHDLIFGTHLREAFRIVGISLLVAYFICTLLNALRIAAITGTFRAHLILHFGILPAGLWALIALGIEPDYYMTFNFFGASLMPCLFFILLNLRMDEPGREKQLLLTEETSLLQEPSADYS